MDSSGQEPQCRAADVLSYIRGKGVHLWSQDGQLHYRAPRGALTREEIEELKVSRPQILALLEQVTGDTAKSQFRDHHRQLPFPLAFSQLVHWHLHELRERRAMRQIASATRVHGRLDVGVLQESVAEIVRRHEALRTRIVILDGVPMQEISESCASALRVDDLTPLAEDLREIEIRRSIDEEILEPIDVTVGPLFGVRLLTLGADDHVLIVVIEHMVADAFSMSILLRDLFAAYVQAMIGRACHLPPVRLQFADYAVSQSNAQRSRIEQHAAYWKEHLAGCQRLRFPEDQAIQTAHNFGRGTVSFRIDRNLKAQLREWCRLRQTTLVMSVFTAYVALTLRWCNASESVVQYQSDGRFSPSVENTVGYFASALYVRARLHEADTFVDLLRRITEEYCKAYEHADFSYMAAQLPRPEFTRNTLFNWVPQGCKIDLSALDGSADAMTCSQVSFAHPMLKRVELNHEPTILFYDADDDVIGDIHFDLSRLSIGTMEKFGRNFLRFLEALVVQPEGSVKDIMLL